MLKKLLHKREKLLSSNTFIVLICIFIATVFWLLNALSDIYTTDVLVNVEYVNAPSDKIVVNQLPDQLTIKVQGLGWQLLREQLNLGRQTVIIDVDRFQETRIFHTNANINYFSNQITPAYEIISISPGVINFEYEELMQKSVPVILIKEISFDPLYVLKDSIQYTPDEITVSGPVSIIRNIEFLETEPIQLENVDTDISGTSPIVHVYPNSVKFSTYYVRYRLQVEAVTETRIEIPIRIINMPEEEVKLLTQHATVSFQIALEDYEIVRLADFHEQFDVVADFSLVGNDENEVPLQLVKSPDNIRRVSFSPGSVEFLWIRQ